MMLLTKAIRAKLIANGELRASELGAYPVCKLFTPDAQFTWLIVEADPEESDRLFGLCDLGMGFPELGYVSLAELERLRGPMGLKVERDLHFRPDKPLTAYANEARDKRRIVA